MLSPGLGVGSARGTETPPPLSLRPNPLHAGGTRGTVPASPPTRGAVPELAARGVIQQVFPLHEQRILKRLMKSWVQAICEAQPLGEAPGRGGGEMWVLGVPATLTSPRSIQMRSVTTSG